MAHLNWKKRGPAPRPVEPPKYDAEDLLGIASADVRIPFDAREVIARIVDGSRFSEFKPLYGPELVCGWAHVHGMPVGILANNGILFTACANKGAQFIQLCNQKRFPCSTCRTSWASWWARSTRRRGSSRRAPR